MNLNNVEIETFPVGMFQCNCSILSCHETLEAIIVDPGDEPEKIVQYVQKKGLKVQYIVHTHAHLDHFGGTHTVKKNIGGKTVMAKTDMFLYDIADMQAERMGLAKTTVSPIDIFAEDEQNFDFGMNFVKTLYTPGHTPGSLCFELSLSKQNILFAGDTLFRRSVGRTDLPGGDFSTLKSSIKERLFSLEAETLVIPGHGSCTTIEEEKKENPFLS